MNRYKNLKVALFILTIPALLWGCATKTPDTAISDQPRVVKNPIRAGKPVAIGDYAVSIMTSPDGSKLYATSDEKNAVHIIDLPSATVQGEIKGPPIKLRGGCPHPMCMGVGASHIAVSDNGRFMLVSSIEIDKVSRIDLATREITHSMPAQRYPRNLLLSTDQKYAYVFNGVADSISSFDLTRNQHLHNYALSVGHDGISPFGRPLTMYINHSNGKDELAVFNQSKEHIDWLSTPDLSLISSTALPEDFYILASVQIPQKHALLLLSKDTLLTIDWKTRKITQTQPLSFCYYLSATDRLAISPDGELLAILELNNGWIRVVYRKTGETRNLFSFQDDRVVSEMIFSRDGKSIYALSSDTGFPSRQPKTLRLHKMDLNVTAEFTERFAKEHISANIYGQCNQSIQYISPDEILDAVTAEP